MNDQIFHNITNQTTTFYHKQSPNLQRTYTTNLKEFMTPMVIKHNPRKSSQKLINKKSSKNFMPKYLYNPPYAIEKQKLLYDIQKENMKLNHQNAIKKTLEKKLQRKLILTQKKAQSLQKFSKTRPQTVQGIERTITSSLQKAFILQPNKNYMKSIQSQIQLLTSEINKNQEAILKIKQSKKYTRYIENEEQKNTFLSQLQNLKRYKKKLKMQINRLKRIHQEKKNLKIQELVMEGEIQNQIEVENIQIYNNIQGLKKNLKQTTFKKATLIKKKNNLMQQIEQLKERHNITDDIVSAYFKQTSSSMYRNKNSLGYYRSVNSTQYRPMSSQLNYLGSLQEQDYEEDDSMENPNYQKRSLNINKTHHTKDMIKENAISTVKVHSNVNSDDGEFIGLQYQNLASQSQSHQQENERQTMEKLDQKYFYEDDNFESEQEMSYKDYDSQQYEQNEGFESENDCQEVQRCQGNQKHHQKMVGVKEQNEEHKSREKQWNNRPLRGISV